MNSFDPDKLKATMLRVEGNLRSTRDITLQNPFCERFTREALDDVYLIMRDCDELIAKQKPLPVDAVIEGSAVVIKLKGAQ